jgi:hypothetical protein
MQAMRAHHDRQLFLRKRRAASTINKAFRAYRARSLYVKAKRAALKIQVRCVMARLSLVMAITDLPFLLWSAVQTWYRMTTLRRKYLKIKKSILVIQVRPYPSQSPSYCF